MIASAHFLGYDASEQTWQGWWFMAARHRFNVEQGYGRIQLDHALPLDSWPASPAGLIAADVIDGGVNDLGPALVPIDAVGDLLARGYDG